MIAAKNLIIRFIFQLGLIMLCYFLIRILFIYINYSSFDIPALFSFDFLRIIAGGARFDLSAFFMTNGLILVLGYFPLHFLSVKVYQKLIGILFVAVNSFFLMLNFADIAYFPFVKKRMHIDILQFMDGNHGNEFFDLIPFFVAQYWYLFIIFFIMVWLIWKANVRILEFNERTKISWKSYAGSISVFVSIFLFTIIGIRGGLQYKPINVIDASKLAAPQNIPVVLNTPFTIIKSVKRKKIGFEVSSDFDPQELNTAIRHPVASAEFKDYNVVLIIVEGLSKQYLGYFSDIKMTPFLDSLMDHSLVFTDFYANGKTTLDGIPAILASIPGWMDHPFIYSIYSDNPITSFGTLLGKQSYSTSFFHGGKNGTMGFNSFARLAGFDYYYAKDEYGNDDDFDGNWGIWDEHFLKFTASELSKKTQPFFSAILTITNHHPFKIPAKYENDFRHEGHPLWSCVRYTDHSLEAFFRQAGKSEWYKNTIFVITADHTALDVYPENKSFMKDFSIPLIIFLPNGRLKGLNSNVGNQIDILPTVMNLLSYPEPYFSLGKDLLNDTEYHFSMNYANNVYSFFDDEYLYLSNGKQSIGFYSYKQDQALQINLENDRSSSAFQRGQNEFTRQMSLFAWSMEKNRLTIGHE
jgi:phosphoglycerol transferase MdoB-like AlkP superfamily enzyme